MKLLKIIANNYKNCKNDFCIDMTARSKKTSEDKLYELQEVAEGLYTFNVNAIVGKNASGKTSVIELLDCCYTILSTFRLGNKHFDYDNIEITMYFYYDDNIYKYYTKLKSDLSEVDKALFVNQRLYKKKYFKTNVKKIFDNDFEEVKINGELPEDTSVLFFILKKASQRAIYFDCYGKDVSTYNTIFKVMKNYNISIEVLLHIIKIFDETIKEFSMIDEHNFRITINKSKMILSDKDLLYRLSSGTTKGLLLYIYVYASLKNGFDLIIDEIENHFHKTIVENIISLYKDVYANKNKATLIFTTHYCELLDLFNRGDNIWITRQTDKIELKNLYDDFNLRSELIKSKKFYENAFDTAVNYDALMELKKVLLK